MAEKIIEFKAKKEIFDNLASRLACSNCKIVPRDVPIFQTGQGVVLCSTCKPKSKSSGIFRSSILEDFLKKSIPIPCKYQKNKCPFVFQDYRHLSRLHLSYHEKDCEFRDVLCSYKFCKEIIPAVEFKKHCLERHEFDLKRHLAKRIISKRDMYVIGVEKKCFDVGWCGIKSIIFNDSKTFVIHARNCNSHVFIWLQLVGSQLAGCQLEARNFEYSLKVAGPPDIGEFNYKGTVRSLDDDKNDICETGMGLAISQGALKKLLQTDCYVLEIKIKDLKAEWLNKCEDSQRKRKRED